jgi:tetratricopeptide (TPR) repeat protein
MFLFAGLGSAIASLFIVRLLVLFGIMFLPIVSSNFNSIFLTTKSWFGRAWPRTGAVLRCIFIVSIISVFIYQFFSIHGSNASRGFSTDWGIGLDRYSNDAGKFFKEQNLKGPIFDDYDIGGYIIYHLFPKEKVFVDNNGADSYPESFFNDIYMPTMMWDEKWQEIERKYGINSIFISIRDASPATGGFLWRRLHDPSWALVYADTYAVIFVKNIPTNQEIIKKFHITPKNIKEKIGYMLESDDVVDRIFAGRILYLVGLEDLSTSVFKKVVAQYPKNSWVWLHMGAVKASKDDLQSLISAIIFLENAVNMGEKTSEGYTWLGLAYFRFGQLEKAEDAFQKALWLDPGRFDATNYLAQLQHRQFIPGLE